MRNPKMPHKQMLATGDVLIEKRKSHTSKEPVDINDINILIYTSIKQIFC